MKAYFEPKMNISSFDKADVITTSGGDISNKVVNNGQAFATVDYNNLKDLNGTSVQANQQIMSN